MKAEALLREGLVSVQDLPKHLPRSAAGKRMHRALGWRWVSVGVRGPTGDRVHLEAVRVGRRWMTSLPAVARFFARVTGNQAPQARAVQRAAGHVIGPETREVLRAHGLAATAAPGNPDQGAG